MKEALDDVPKTADNSRNDIVISLIVASAMTLVACFVMIRRERRKGYVK